MLRGGDGHQDGLKAPCVQHDAHGEQCTSGWHVVHRRQARPGSPTQQHATLRHRDGTRPNEDVGDDRGKHPGGLFAPQRRPRTDRQHLQKGIGDHGEPVQRPRRSDRIVQRRNGSLAVQQPPPQPCRGATDRGADQFSFGRGCGDPQQQRALRVAVDQVLDRVHQQCHRSADHATEYAGHEDRGGKNQLGAQAASQRR